MTGRLERETVVASSPVGLRVRGIWHLNGPPVGLSVAKAGTSAILPLMAARGVALFAGTAAAVVAVVAERAEGLGFTSFWLNHPGRTDGVAGLAAAADTTAAIELGVGVVPLHVREVSDVVAAVRAHELPVDRLLVGIGTSGSGAFALARAGVSELHEQLHCRVVMGALSEPACRLAGGIADGVLFNWLTPEHAQRSVRWVEEGAKLADRPRPRLYAYVRVAVGAGARERIEQEGDRYAGGSYGAHFERMHARPIETAIAAGSPKDVTAGLAAWAGIVDEIVLRFLPASPTLDDHLAILEAAAPYSCG